MYFLRLGKKRRIGKVLKKRALNVISAYFAHWTSGTKPNLFPVLLGQHYTFETSIDAVSLLISLSETRITEFGVRTIA